MQSRLNATAVAVVGAFLLAMAVLFLASLALPAQSAPGAAAAVGPPWTCAPLPELGLTICDTFPEDADAKSSQERHAP